MMVCLFWAAFFIIRFFQPGDELRVKRSIVLFYLAATILYFDHWLFFSGVIRLAGEWSYGIVNLCVYPLYYAYLRALTRANRGGYELSALFSPALIAVFLFPVGRYTGLLTDDQTFLFVRISFSIQVVWVLVRGYQLLHNTIRRMDNTYSDYRSRLLQPTRISLILFGATSAVSMILNFLGRDYFTQNASVAAPAVVMTCLLFGLGYVAAHTLLPVETVSEEPVLTQPETEEETDTLIRVIDTTMREQRLYTRSDLTILDLAAAVNSNRTYVSNAINRTYRISFSQYIARQRVAYAQMVLKDTRYKTDKAAVADAIMLSGFTSDQNFYRVFKEQTGLTPLQFRHQNS